MTTENDKAWQLYLKTKGIVFDQPAYWVEATELRTVTGREPRLLAKFDTPDQLPKPFREAGYTVLPIRNGRYQILRGNLFIEIPVCATHTEFQPVLPFPLETTGRGSGEAQYIDQAFNIGLLAHFLDLRDMYLTIRGREFTGAFEFQLQGVRVQVDSVQIEVDAGYEALQDIVLIEAKTGIPRYFNVRQIYYPYRHFSALVPHKRLHNLLLIYDIQAASYHLYEYAFLELADPLSVYLTRCTTYRIAPAARLSIYEHRLIDAHFETRNQLVPQADDLNKVYEMLTLIDAGLIRAEEIADYFVFDKRQSSYYREAAEYLGLISPFQRGMYTLTDLGVKLLSEPPEAKTLMLAKVVINSWIFAELIRRAGRNGLFTDADIDAMIASVKNTDGSQRYTGTRVGRRRRTIISWLRWLARELGCFAVSGSGYTLR